MLNFSVKFTMQTVIKPIPGCVHIACSGLMSVTTNLQQVANRGLMQVDCQDFLSTSLMQVVQTSLQK